MTKTKMKTASSVHRRRRLMSLQNIVAFERVLRPSPSRRRSLSDAVRLGGGSFEDLAVSAIPRGRVEPIRRMDELR
jgi:hypothetical protein